MSTLICTMKEPSDQVVSTIESQLEKGWKVIDYDIKDHFLYVILGDQKDFIYGKTVAIYKIEEVETKIQLIKQYENDFSKVKPWKINCKDVEGDGETEIIVGVYKKTHFDPNEGNRVFVFNWDGKKIYKKWTGSKLGNKLMQYEFIDFLDLKGDELIVVDLDEGGKEKLLIYYWFDFGFSLLAESKSYDRISNVTYLGTNLLEITYIHKGIKNIKKISIIKDKVVDVTN